MKVRFHPEARSEHLVAARYYEQEERGLGSHSLEAIERAARRIGDSPRSFPIYKGPFRRLHVGEFPYTLFFSIEPDSVLIVAVAHQSREPEYWIDRGD